MKKAKRIQIITPNSTPSSQHEHELPRELTESSSIIRTQPSSSSTKITKGGNKLEWVVLPVFVDIVKLALKAREDCSTR